MDSISGRENEIEALDDLLKSKTADLLAVYGRRRVGKTYMIQTCLRGNIVFHLTGMYQSGLKNQLQQFSIALQLATGSTLALKPPANWIEAFQALQAYLTTLLQKKKLVVFLDEFPWLEGRKSGFLSAFEHFWNNWASRQPQVLMVICGSSASWMLKNIINNKGGLHNRITAKMPLAPFTLAETEAYLRSIGCKLDRYQVLQIYMAFGGIPHYLKTVGKDKSAAQVIERTCFSKQGLLTGEFDNLYSSLFELADNHVKVVRALGANGKGLTRQELITSCGISSGGRATVVLDELEKSGFIQQTIPYGKVSKDAIYRLIDEFSIFYLKFMDKRRPGGKDVWAKISEEPSYAIWCGIAFEAVCLKHIEQIMDGLKIRKGAEIAAWRFVPSKGSKEKGAQIDLIIDRKDLVINICEMKFYNKKFTIDKNYAAILQQKAAVFAEKLKPRKTLFITMITTYGIVDNEYADKLVQQQLDMNALFKAI
ncbi:MAG: ATP-binding protein [Chitinophagaceae bacterium]